MGDGQKGDKEQPTGGDIEDLQKENRHAAKPNLLNIRFTWEDRQRMSTLLEEGDLKGGNLTANLKVSDSKYQASRKSEVHDDQISRGSSPVEDNSYYHRGPSHRLGRSLLTSSTVSFAGRTKEKLQLSPERLPLPSLLTRSRNRTLRSSSGIIFDFITKPALESDDMPKQTAFVYVGKGDIINILSTLDYSHPILSELYLHTQMSLSHGAPRSCEQLSISNFLEGFINPALDPTLTNKLKNYWWSIECSLPSGVMMIHSLQLSTYQGAFILKFSPVTGVFSNLVPPAIADMRLFLVQNPNNPRFFPGVPAPVALTDRQKLRTQLGSGTSLASRSLTNLANLLPSSVTRKFSGPHVQTLGTALSDGILDGIRNNIVPALTAWNNTRLRISQIVTTVPALILSNVPRQVDENQSPQITRSHRPNFLRSGVKSTLKHPLQMLRHAQLSTTSIASRAPSSPTIEPLPPVHTPVIILTTPETETRVLKLGATVPQTTLQSINRPTSLHSTTVNREPPTFVFWGDIFDELVFDTAIPTNMGTVNLELDTNVNEQIKNDLGRLLTAITEMYANVADGMQIDFIRTNIATRNKMPGYNGLQTSRNTRLAEIKAQGAFRTGPGAAIAGNALKATKQADECLALSFGIPSLELSSVLVSPDTFVVESIIAGWFNDAAEWIGNNELRWRDALFAHQAGQVL
ncbi:hypothetical protein DRE_03413 [Drechslerella stenobrocha 248]|uniref:Uncharacterized protein n=1 Tax=Drechslerella stenobrocha 248 TaxID=1043628 RepID=W7HUU4_9PEZI|nr:hypothetical protein DRE_03413 [Drechslerella stenobrocha 248]